MWSCWLGGIMLTLPLQKMGLYNKAFTVWSSQAILHLFVHLLVKNSIRGNRKTNTDIFLHIFEHLWFWFTDPCIVPLTLRASYSKISSWAILNKILFWNIQYKWWYRMRTRTRISFEKVKRRDYTRRTGTTLHRTSDRTSIIFAESYFQQFPQNQARRSFLTERIMSTFTFYTIGLLWSADWSFINGDQENLRPVHNLNDFECQKVASHMSLASPIARSVHATLWMCSSSRSFIRSQTEWQCGMSRMTSALQAKQFLSFIGALEQSILTIWLVCFATGTAATPLWQAISQLASKVMELFLRYQQDRE